MCTEQNQDQRLAELESIGSPFDSCRYRTHAEELISAVWFIVAVLTWGVVPVWLSWVIVAHASLGTLSSILLAWKMRRVKSGGGA